MHVSHFAWLCIAVLVTGQDKKDITALDCSFNQENICDYVTDRTTDYHRFVDSAEREAGKVLDGPLSGSTADGYYLEPINSKLWFTSPIIKEQSPFCLSFYYYMIGNNPGDFLISQTSGETGHMDTIFYRGNVPETTDCWHHFEETVHQTGSASYSFKFDRPNNHTVMALDDIKTSAGRCVKSRDYCDFDFAANEELDCPWLRPSSTDPSWTWAVRSAMKASHELPGEDRSSGNMFGKYLTASEYETAQNGSKVTLTIDKIASGSTMCFSFWFAQRDKIKLSLTKSARDAQGDSYEEELWTSADANTGYSWDRKQFQLEATGVESSFVLSMVKHEDSTGPAAFDSFLLTPGTCSEPVTCSFDENFCGFTSEHATWFSGWGRLTNPDQVFDDEFPTFVRQKVRLH
ncbi:MAM and LDL-receptor class A domain-containing protein 1 [Halotydeus destructor]|nr:MAM and LDL-receptor class A domain-containing protein 1 [Halotydeus destructor]